MAKTGKKSVRAQFRRDVFRRDAYRCKCCGKPGRDRQGGDDHRAFCPGGSNDDNTLSALDAHHIVPRDQMPHGGYVKENGITVCDECHIKAEDWYADPKVEWPGFHPDDLFKLIGSSIHDAWKALGV